MDEQVIARGEFMALPCGDSWKLSRAPTATNLVVPWFVPDAQIADLARVAAAAAGLRVAGPGDVVVSVERLDALLDALADQEHARWSHWMAYMLSCGRTTKYGSWIMPPEKLDRWRRQMDTNYADLSEQERESDRQEARETLALLQRFTAAPEEAS